MKVLFLTPYPEEGASNRYRVLQYLPYLEQAGIQYSVKPFVFPAFYKIIYKPGNYLKKIWYFTRSTLHRIRDIAQARKYDVIFIHRECYPIGPPIFEKILSLLGKPIVYDFDDAIYLPTGGKLKNFLKNPEKINKVIAWSDHVIVCNDYLEQYTLKFNKHATVIPTPLNTRKFVPSQREKEKKRLVIGWVGSHTTTKYLDILTNVFQKLRQRYDFDLLIVGANKNIEIPGVHVINRKWTLEREVKDFQEIDIGVYPLIEDEWAIGKTGFKTIQYMAIGIPCVVSDVGANKTTIQDGVNGFLASSEAEWLKKLSLLIEHADLREKIGGEGRKTVVERFSTDVTSKMLLAMLRELGKPVILHLISDLDIGGTEKMLAELVKHLSKKKYRILVCSIKPKGLVAQEIQAIKKIRLVSLNVWTKWDISAFFKLYRLLKKERVVILQTYLFFDNILGRVVGRMASVPIIISGQRYLYEGEPLWRILIDKWTARMSTLIISNSAAAKQGLLWLGIGKQKIQVIYNGKDFSLYDTIRQDEGPLTTIKKSHALVGTIARLNKVKGHQHFLEAARIILDTMPSTRFIVVGDGPLRKTLEKQVQALQMEHAVRFLGNRKDILPILAQLDISVLSSLAESFPGALLESMGMGKPVVATSVGGIPEMVLDGKTGYLVKPANPRQLAEKILVLLQSKERREAMGRNAQEYVQKRFSYQQMVASYEHVYDTLLKKVSAVRT